MYMCTRGIHFASVSPIFLSDFGAHILFSILLHILFNNLVECSKC